MCGNVVVKQALTCPKCGQQNPGMPGSRTLTYVNVLIVGIVGFGAAIGFIRGRGTSFGGLSIVLGVIALIIGIIATAVGIISLKTAKKTKEQIEEKFNKS